MFQYVMLFFTAICLGTQTILQKQYNKKTGTGSYLFCAVLCLAALLFFGMLAWITGSFEPRLLLENLPYSVAFSIFFTAAIVFSTLAITVGPLSLTALIVQYSLLIPTLYGVLFRQERLSRFFWPGLFLLLLSLFLVNFQKENTKISLRWILFVTLAFIGNGGCSTVQKIQQLSRAGNGKNELMIGALCLSACFFLLLSWFRQKGTILFCLKKGGLFAALAGICNGGANLAVMYLATRLSSAVMYPIISAGSILFVFTISRFVFRETLSKTQYMGFLLGVLTIVLFNL